MTRIVKEYMQAMEKAQYDYKEAIGNAGNQPDWKEAIITAAKTHQEVVAKAGMEAIEKTKKLLGVKDA